MLTVGDKIEARELSVVSGEDVPIPMPGRKVHLQLRRFAGCPICNLHLREVARRSAEIERAGVTEVIVFHSETERLREYVPDFPFAMVADPKRKLYREFGVEWSLRSILYPAAFRAAARGLRQTTSLTGALAPTENHLGKPADFLIEPDGAIRACKYGAHADDQWSVDELLALAADDQRRT
jgi:peroxiredoxin